MIKPTVLIGSSGVGKTFTKEVIEAVASFNDVNSLFFSLRQNFVYIFLSTTITRPEKTNLLQYCDIQKPLILALSNPTSQSECTAEEAYTWSKVKLIHDLS